MVKLVVNLAIAAWLLVSAFVLPHSSTTAWNAMIVAALVAAVAFLAFVAPGRPGLKYGIAALAVWLFASALFLPHESLGTVLHDAGIGALLALVTLLPSHRWDRHGAPHARPA
jgi:ABC-type transport system involved in cytochrome bd biosynthesis fused ATPase/permease subunit